MSTCNGLDASDVVQRVIDDVGGWMLFEVLMCATPTPMLRMETESSNGN